MTRHNSQCPLSDAEAVIECAPIGIFQSTPEGRLLTVNPAYARIHGYESPEQMLAEVQNTIDLYASPETREELLQRLERDGGVEAFRSLRLGRDGRHVWVSSSIRADRDASGNITLLHGFVTDITQLVETERHLSRAYAKSRKLERILHRSPAVAWSFLTNPWREVEFVSENVRQYGISPGDILDSSFLDLVHPEDRNRVVASIRAATNSGQDFLDMVYRLRQPDGSHIWLDERSWISRDSEGRALRFEGITLDVTAKHEAELKLETSLREKVVLLQEIHHRVKNNLQVVSSLLSLQAQTSGDDVLASHLSDSRNRILAMALVHEKLYQSHDLSRVDMSDYLLKLTNHLRTVYASGPSVTVSVRCDDVFLDIDKAIPCGLILGELVSNAFKHAFRGLDSGRLDVVLRHSGREYVLIVEDDGVGLTPPGADANPTLGSLLVRNLARQLDGNLEISSGSDAGTLYRLAFTED